MKEKDPPKESEPAPVVQVTPPAAAKVIVLHPGSYNLRVGLASESYPHVVPHIIARRIYNQQVSDSIKYFTYYALLHLHMHSHSHMTTPHM
jgi:actin-related protein